MFGRLQSMGEVGTVIERAVVSRGADTKANTLGAAAHLRLVIFVSLRMAASAVAPWAPIWLPLRLRARGRMGDGERVGVSVALTRHSWGGGALERGHGAPLDPFAQLGDALGGVGTVDILIIILVEAAEQVVGQAASTGM